jgi:hypothetical protein
MSAFSDVMSKYKDSDLGQKIQENRAAAKEEGEDVSLAGALQESRAGAADARSASAGMQAVPTAEQVAANATPIQDLMARYGSMF